MKDLAQIVKKRIKGLVERGVIRGFSETPKKRGKILFEIRWLYNQIFELECDAGKSRLSINAMLPNVKSRSFMDNDLRKFTASRNNRELPSHRRVDPDRARLIYSNRKGVASIAITSLDHDFNYAISALLNMTKDLFSHIQLYHIDYLHKEFGLPEE